MCKLYTSQVCILRLCDTCALSLKDQGSAVSIISQLCPTKHEGSVSEGEPFKMPQGAAQN